MEHIWAPWRIQYIQMDKSQKCILCDKLAENNDVANYILYRGAKNFVIMNSYPYNPGHLLVAPNRHVAAITDLETEERSEHFEIVNRCVAVLKEVFSPGGFNLGINQGKIAGAGIDDHMHTHIVPRWQGDTNFMTVVANTRVLPEALSVCYGQLREKFV